jgi:hypothetical protein
MSQLKYNDFVINPNERSMLSNFSLKQLQQYAKDNDINVPRKPILKLELINRIEHGRRLTANQIREVADFYGVHLRKGNITKDTLIEYLIKARILDPSQPFLDLDQKYTMLCLRKKKFSINPLAGVSRAKIPSDIRERMDRLKHLSYVGQRPDIEYDNLQKDYEDIKNYRPHMSPYEVKIFDNQIAPIIESRLER